MTVACVLPPPPVRVILQPSLHGRGIRNYVYSGEIDEWHAPGVLVKKGDTRCAVDAAWLVERVLGKAKKEPAIWPGVPGVRERAIALGAARGLYQYQQQGAAFLAERDYAGLFDQPGVGKTAQALIAAEARLAVAVVPSPTTPVVLILCPALAKRHWQREVMKWTSHEASVLESLTPEELPQTRYVICNYDILCGAQRRDASGVKHDVEHLPGWAMTLTGRFPIVIIDEAHAYRSRTSKRTRVTKRMLMGTPVVWALTGTPMPNYVRDLWALIDLISNGLWGFSYWDWAKKYCLDPSTPVLRADGVYVPIGSLQVGDKVMGWRTDRPDGARACFEEATVEGVMVREAEERLAVRMASGSSLICTPDHNWYTGRSEKEFRYRPLYGHGHRRLKRLQVAAPQPTGDDPTGDADYQLGYLRGLLDGDGHARTRPRHRKGGPGCEATITGEDDEHLDRAFSFSLSLGMSPRMSKRHASDDCRRLSFYRQHDFSRLTQPLTDDFSDLFKRGWLAGMYDAEGGSFNLICQVTSEDKRNRIDRWLRNFGFDTVFHTLSVSFKGGRFELLRFWELVRPVLVRKLQRDVLGTINVVHHTDDVVEKTPIGPGTVVSIRTSTGNFIANGYMSKNCDAAQAQYGWKDTGRANLDELRSRMTFFCLGRSADTVGLELPEKRREIYRIDVTVSAPTVAEGNAAMTKSGFVAKALRMTARAKRSAVVAQVVEALEAKQKVVVFVYMREQAEEIAKAVKEKVDCPVSCVHGDLTPDGRDAQAGIFREIAAPAAFIATIDSVGVAISLVGADLVLYGDLVPEPWKLLQSEKRCHRHGSTKRVLVRYLIGTGTLDEGVAESVVEKLAAIEAALGADSESQEVSGMLGGERKSDETIIDGLFARLKAMKGSDEE
jgi:hypothetical protein